MGLRGTDGPIEGRRGRACDGGCDGPEGDGYSCAQFEGREDGTADGVHAGLVDDATVPAPVGLSTR